MASLTPSTLRSRIKAGKLPAVLVILGDDEVEKTGLAMAVSDTIPEDLQPFNLHRLHADHDAASAAAVSSARTLPMLGDRRVVLLLRAERLFKRASRKVDEEAVEAEEDDEPSSPEVGALETYVQAPEPSTCFVIVALDINRATRLGRLLVKHADVVECWGLKPGKDARSGDAVPVALAKAAAIIKERVSEAGLTISEDAVVPLLEHCGTNISVLRGDLDRLLLYCLGRRGITRADVVQVVGGATSIDAWAMTRAVERGAAGAALKELALALDGGAVPYAVLGQLAWLVRSALPRFAPHRVAEALEAVFRTDVALKSSGGEPRVLLERLVVELCGPARRRPQPSSGRR